jgi:hypothetical protein
MRAFHRGFSRSHLSEHIQSPCTVNRDFRSTVGSRQLEDVIAVALPKLTNRVPRLLIVVITLERR